MISDPPEIILVASARSYHVMDWYRTLRHVLKNKTIVLASDLFCSEGYVNLTTSADRIIPLVNIDHFLFRTPSRHGNIWRNIVKLIVAPVQVWKLKRLRKTYPQASFHAISMYYIFLCYLAGIDFIATPLGSDILVRPKRSRVYKYFAIQSLTAAQKITVDSHEMKRSILEMCGKEALVIQNGVNVSEIQKLVGHGLKTRVVSIRAIDPLYRIDQILEARDRSHKYPEQGIDFLYPFYEANYRSEQWTKLKKQDRDLGRLPKNELYALLDSTLLAVSIPSSDSSPRTVYEAIFAGCCVAVSYGRWLDLLPACMRARVTVVDLEDDQWLTKAIEFAQQVGAAPFVPSQQAIDTFDQNRSLKLASAQLYRSVSLGQ